MELTRKEKYHRYLKSDWWKEIKKKKLAKNCCICSNTKSLILHHFSYEKIYKPKISKASKDVVTVCMGCHHLIHSIQKERNLTYEQTKDVVQELGRQWERRCLDFNNTQRKSKPCLLRCRLKPLLEKIVSETHWK